MAASWEIHRDTIHALYIDDNATLESVMLHMKTVHGFQPEMKKDRYLRRFKKWGIQKNRNAAEWKTVHRKVAWRARQGMDTQVYLGGKKVTKRRLDKEKSLYITTREEWAATGDVPPTPEGFIVCTPRSRTTALIFIDNLPSLTLLRQLRPRVCGLTEVVLSITRHSISLGNFDLLDHSRGEPSVEVNSGLALALSQGSKWVSFLTNSDKHFELSSGPGSLESDANSSLDLTNLCRNQHFRILLSLLHSASNNLLSERQASVACEVISQNGNRKLFQNLIAIPSPTTRAIARTFLPAAIESFDLDMVGKLLDTGISPNSRISMRAKPLHTAIRERHADLQMIRLLLDRGADANAKEFGTSALEAAIDTHRLDIVQLLLERDAHVNVEHRGWTPLRGAVRTGQTDLVQLILRTGADMVSSESDGGSSALNSAIASGKLDLVDLLVDAGADVGAHLGIHDATALQAAAHSGRFAIAKLLLSRDAAAKALRAEDSLKATENRVGGKSFDDLWTNLVFGEQFRDIWGNYSRRSIHSTQRRLALEKALLCNDVKLIRSLLEPCFVQNAASVKADIRATSALPFAAYRGSIELTQLLLSLGADVNASVCGSFWDLPGLDGPPHGATALQMAALKNHSQLVLILLCSGADVNAYHHVSKNPLWAAVYWNDIDMARLLLIFGADINRQGKPAIAEAISKGSVELIRLLLDTYVSAGDTDLCLFTDCPLVLAAEHCDVEITRVLLEYNCGHKTLALRAAVKSRKTEVVRLLLASGAEAGQQEYERRARHWTTDPDGNRFRAFSTAICNAVEENHLDILRLLLEHRTTADDKVQALQIAASRGKIDALQLLVDPKYAVNVNSAPLDWLRRTPRTALQAAAEIGNLRIVRCLLDAGAHVESKAPTTREKGTALQFAAIVGSLDVVTALFQEGVNVNAPAMGKHGRTALEGAAEHGCLDLVQLLFNLGVEHAGSRALRFARKEGHDSVVELLLENGVGDLMDGSVNNDDSDDDEYSSDEDELWDCDWESEGETLVIDLET